MSPPHGWWAGSANPRGAQVGSRLEPIPGIADRSDLAPLCSLIVQNRPSSGQKPDSRVVRMSANRHTIPPDQACVGRNRRRLAGGRRGAVPTPRGTPSLRSRDTAVWEARARFQPPWQPCESERPASREAVPGFTLPPSSSSFSLVLHGSQLPAPEATASSLWRCARHRLAWFSFEK